MQQAEFEKLFRETIELMNKLLIVKGGEYAGSSDRLGNFKRGASRAGTTPMQTLWIYAAKHIDSIETFIKDDAAGKDRERSEPIRGRVHDLMNYCVLLLAIIEEAEPTVNRIQQARDAEMQAKLMRDYEAARNQNADQTSIPDRNVNFPSGGVPPRNADGSYSVPSSGTSRFGF